MRDIKYIVLHCSATAQSATVEAIKKYWKEKLGWKSPGYHLIIKPDGEVVQLLAYDKISNGVKGYNSESINICYIGGKDIDDRTEAQKKSLQKVVTELRGKYPKAEVLGHRDFPKVAKACPRFDARAWSKTFVLLMALMLGGCSANWHLNRAVKKNPELAKAQMVTFTDTVVFEIPEIYLKDSVVFYFDTVSDVKAISQNYNLSEKEAAEIRRLVSNRIMREIEKDTASIDTLFYNIRAYNINGKIKIDFLQKKDAIKQSVEIRVPCPPQLVYTPIKKWWFWPVVIICAAIVLAFIGLWIAKKFRF